MAKESEAYVKEGLSLTKRLHTRMRELEQQQSCSDPTPVVDFAELKSMAANVNKLLVNLRRQLVSDAHAESASQSILRQALKDELIDRDANAARVAERQRLAAERGHGIAALAQRGEEAVGQINLSIAALCPWQIGLSTSVPMIANAQQQARDA